MPKMLLRVLEDTTKYGNLSETTDENNIYMRISVVAFPNGNEVLLKYNFSLAEQSYAGRGFVLFFANHRNLEITFGCLVATENLKEN